MRCLCYVRSVCCFTLFGVCSSCFVSVLRSAFLSPERFKQLQGKPQQAAAAIASVRALADVEDHPSRTLVERLVADDDAWRSVCDEWKKLTDNKAVGTVHTNFAIKFK